MSRNSAVKVLDHAMAGKDGGANCQKFVEILGLRSIAPLFMKTPKANKKGPGKKELEEHIISIMASLLRHCSGPQRQRLLSKFVENDHEKVDRLMELHFKYLERVRRGDEQIDLEKAKLKRLGQLDDEEEDAFYLRRLDSGLFILQQIGYIMLEAVCSGTPSVRARVMQMLSMRGGSAKSIRSIMREYAGNIGDSATESNLKEAEQSRILELIAKF